MHTRSCRVRQREAGRARRTFQPGLARRAACGPGARKMRSNGKSCGPRTGAAPRAQRAEHDRAPRESVEQRMPRTNGVAFRRDAATIRGTVAIVHTGSNRNFGRCGRCRMLRRPKGRAAMLPVGIRSLPRKRSGIELRDGPFGGPGPCRSRRSIRLRTKVRQFFGTFSTKNGKSAPAS